MTKNVLARHRRLARLLPLPRTKTSSALDFARRLRIEKRSDELHGLLRPAIMESELSDVPNQRRLAGLRRNGLQSRAVGYGLTNHEIRRLLGRATPAAWVLRLAGPYVNLQSHQTNVLDLGG